MLYMLEAVRQVLFRTFDLVYTERFRFSNTAVLSFRGGGGSIYVSAMELRWISPTTSLHLKIRDSLARTTYKKKVDIGRVYIPWR